MGNETSGASETKGKKEQDTSKKPINTKQPGAKAEAKPKDKSTDDDEKKEPHKGDKTPLDVAFVLDCTGSMNSYIQSCKDNIIAISSKISKEVDNCDVQFALVSYRDIPPQDKTFVTKILNFTPIPFKIQIELQQISASGGGDQPEALTSALYACHKQLEWRNPSIKIIIVITDAPPHGLETHVEDGFPDGDPDTFNTDGDKEGASKDSGAKTYLNIIQIIQDIRNDLKAAIYSVACEPDLSCNNDYANDFMQYIAQYTKGKFLPLSSAKLLPDVIVGSVKQQMRLDDLTNRLDEEIKKIKLEHGDDISSEELNKILMVKLKDEGVKKKEISIGTLYRNERSRENIELLMNEQRIKSLADFKAQCKKLPRIKRSDFRHIDKGKKNVKAYTPPAKKGTRKYYSESDSVEYDSCAETDEDDDDDEGILNELIGATAVLDCMPSKEADDDLGTKMKRIERMEFDNDLSESDCSQHYYSRSASLSEGYMNDVLERINVKSEK
eukprot:605127_1